MSTDKARGDQLDAANRATFRKHYRNIIDRGLGDHEDSALAPLLADIRANAEQVYGDAPRAPRAKGV